MLLNRLHHATWHRLSVFDSFRDLGLRAIEGLEVDLVSAGIDRSDDSRLGCEISDRQILQTFVQLIFYLGLDKPEVRGVRVSLVGIRDRRGVAEDVLHTHKMMAILRLLVWIASPTNV